MADLLVELCYRSRRGSDVKDLVLGRVKLCLREPEPGRLAAAHVAGNDRHSRQSHSIQKPLTHSHESCRFHHLLHPDVLSERFLLKAEEDLIARMLILHSAVSFVSFTPNRLPPLYFSGALPGSIPVTPFSRLILQFTFTSSTDAKP